MNYPNGKQNFLNINSEQIKPKRHILSAANRGMDLENRINETNEFYTNEQIALITKRPTPIKVLNVDYTHAATITKAFFEKQSTTDYNGVFNGKYLDFEAKSTFSKTSFPLSNISPHQIDHLKRVINHGGIAFFIISFEKLNEVYFLDAKYVIEIYSTSKRQSIPYKEIKIKGKLIEIGVAPPLNYIKIIKEYYSL